MKNKSIIERTLLIIFIVAVVIELGITVGYAILSNTI